MRLLSVVRLMYMYIATNSLVVFCPEHCDLIGHVVHHDGAVLGDDNPPRSELL